MDTVVDLMQWRSLRQAEREPRIDVDRLERAIQRLDALATVALEAQGQLEPWVETQLLAIMGALSMDLFDEAAERAERLADRIARKRPKRVVPT